jgi:hypothetical protein
MLIFQQNMKPFRENLDSQFLSNDDGFYLKNEKDYLFHFENAQTFII